MLDIPFLRFAVPTAILYIFYYMLVVNPPIEEDGHRGLSPEDVRVLRWKGAALMESKSYDEAEDVYVKLHKEFADNSFYSGELAKIRHSQRRYEEEAAMWEDYMQHAPVPVEGCPQIGVAYRLNGQDDKALDAMKRCWEYEPTNSDMILFYALELEHNGEKKHANELYAKGHVVSPHYSDITVGLARTDLSMGHTAEARKLILEALERSPDSADALLAAGIILSRCGDKAGARRYLEHGVEVSPDYSEMRTALAAMGGSSASSSGKQKKRRNRS
jgi:tetratricopeptide (TPR) repeat protein